jgi:hypothetical protein
MIYSVLQKEVKMTKGRNTSTITVRLADAAVEALKTRAVKVGTGYTIIAREFILDGLKAAHKDNIVSNLSGDAKKTKAKNKTKGKRKRRH